LSAKKEKRSGKKQEAPGVEGMQEFRQRLRESSPNGHRIEFFDEASLVENLHLTNVYYDKNLPGELSLPGTSNPPWITSVSSTPTLPEASTR